MPDENKEESVAPEKLDIAARAVTYEKVLKFIISLIGVEKRVRKVLPQTLASGDKTWQGMSVLLGSHLGHFWVGCFAGKTD